MTVRSALSPASTQVLAVSLGQRAHSRGIGKGLKRRALFHWTEKIEDPTDGPNYQRCLLCESVAFNVGARKVSFDAQPAVDLQDAQGPSTTRRLGKKAKRKLSIPSRSAWKQIRSGRETTGSFSITGRNRATARAPASSVSIFGCDQVALSSLAH